jgi:hypothetical protein
MRMIWIGSLALVYLMLVALLAIPFFIKEVFIDLTGIGK